MPKLDADLSSHTVLSDEHEQLTREVLGQVAGKWSLGVLCVLAKAPLPLRFTQVLKAVGGVTQKALTTTLRNLERDGFVSRVVFPQVPPRVEYALTDLGHALYLHVDPLVEWARSQVSAFEAARRRAVAGL